MMIDLWRCPNSQNPKPGIIDEKPIFNGEFVMFSCFYQRRWLTMYLRIGRDIHPPIFRYFTEGPAQ